MQARLVKTIITEKVEPNFNLEAHDYYLEGNMKRGDIISITFKGKCKLFIACPGCGEGSFCNHTIKIDGSKITTTPSLVFNCCGWHGYLTNNVFKSV